MAENIGTLIGQGAMESAVRLLLRRGRDPEAVDIEALLAAIRREAKVELQRLHSDVRSRGNVSNDWFRAKLKQGCDSAAERAVDTL